MLGPCGLTYLQTFDTTQIGKFAPYARTNWDGQHKSECASKRIAQIRAYIKVADGIALATEVIFGSQIMMQIYNKVLTEHNEKWKVIRKNVKHRFGSIVGPIDDLLNSFHLIHELLVRYDHCNRVISTFKSKQSAYVKALHIFRTSQQQKSQPPKLSATKPKPVKRQLVYFVTKNHRLQKNQLSLYYMNSFMMKQHNSFVR